MKFRKRLEGKSYRTKTIIIMPSRNQRKLLRLGRSMIRVGARGEEGHGQANRTI